MIQKRGADGENYFFKNIHFSANVVYPETVFEFLLVMIFTYGLFASTFYNYLYIWGNSRMFRNTNTNGKLIQDEFNKCNKLYLRFQWMMEMMNWTPNVVEVCIYPFAPSCRLWVIACGVSASTTFRVSQ